MRGREGCLRGEREGGWWVVGGVVERWRVRKKRLVGRRGEGLDMVAVDLGIGWFFSQGGRQD